LLNGVKLDLTAIFLNQSRQKNSNLCPVAPVCGIGGYNFNFLILYADFGTKTRIPRAGMVDVLAKNYAKMLGSG
jgi:hypothetical protein